MKDTCPTCQWIGPQDPWSTEVHMCDQPSLPGHNYCQTHYDLVYAHGSAMDDQHDRDNIRWLVEHIADNEVQSEIDPELQEAEQYQVQQVLNGICDIDLELDYDYDQI